MEFTEVLIRAASFVAIILLGYGLRRKGFFQEDDFHVLSKIVLKITLPAAIISSFANKEVSVSLLGISVLGLLGGIVYMSVMCLLNLRSSKGKRAFDVLNTAGYNIGNFTLPFAQSFLGPVGVITTSLFDTGNAIVCLGGAYSMASIIKGEQRESPVRQVLRAIVRSVPFDTYVIMITLSLLHIRVPMVVTSIADIIGNGNAFMAMLMMGVGFKISGDREQIGTIVRILAVRYGVAVLLALAYFFLLPLGLEYRQTLAILVFSPIASAAPAFTADLKEDFGLSSAVNSISIVISIVCIVAVLGIVM